jgi:L-lactate dehydrogenase complex protein LldE
MRVGLFIPCYIDQFYPGVAIATLELLEKLNVDVVYPQEQVCCGQPMANAGFEHLTTTFTQSFRKNFKEFDYVVCPSGSCTLHIRDHVVSKDEKHTRVMEVSEFLTDILQIKTLNSRFPHKVGIHQSCHGQRGLKLAQMSELVAPPFSKTEALLLMVDGIELISLGRKDECCGFGGTFCVSEEAVSVKMGKDRIADHQEHGVEYITGSDMSCLMHLEGILKRDQTPMKVIHLVEILNGKN